jgi:hypothetical protein
MSLFAIGGLVTPLFGWIVDHHGLRATVAVMSFLPAICLVLVLVLPREVSRQIAAK